MKRVLSWDVGIINLSYCLIEYNDKKEWTIIDWDIINLTNREKEKCYQCGAKPSFVYKIEDKFTCKNHMKHLNTTPPEFDNIVKKNTENKCCFEGKVKCEKPSKYMFNEKYYCNNHSKSEYKKYCNLYKLIDYNRKSVKSTSLDEIRLKLLYRLDELSLLLTANTVVIENQPTLKNPRMKAISSTLYDYYMLRGMVDKSITKSNITRVKYMCPSNKLKLADDGDTQKLVKLKGDDAKQYKLTKELGIKYCKIMVKPYQQWTDKINSFKKQDDMADSFLQGIYYISYME